MARAPTTVDAFAAIAEPRRREILGKLAGGEGERDVTWLVEQLGWPQPQVSKHLGVLRKVGLVDVVQRGKRRVYSLNGEKLRPVYEWVKEYERFRSCSAAATIEAMTRSSSRRSRPLRRRSRSRTRKRGRSTARRRSSSGRCP